MKLISPNKITALVYFGASILILVVGARALVQSGAFGDIGEDQINIVTMFALAFEFIMLALYSYTIYNLLGYASDGVHAQTTVGQDVGGRVRRQHRERRDQGLQFHSVVGRVRIVAVLLRLDLAVLHPHHAPAARTWIWHRTAIGEHAGIRPAAVLREDLGEGQVFFA